MLRKETNTARANGSCEAEGAGICTAGAGFRNAESVASAESDGLGLGDADDVVTIRVGGGVVLFRVPDCVAENLGYAFRAFILEAGEAAEARAAAIDAKGRGGGDENMKANDGGDSR